MCYCILFFFGTHYSVRVCVCVCVLVQNAYTEYTMTAHYIKSPMEHDVCIKDQSYGGTNTMHVHHMGHYMRLHAYVRMCIFFATVECITVCVMNMAYRTMHKCVRFMHIYGL